MKWMKEHIITQGLYTCDMKPDKPKMKEQNAEYWTQNLIDRGIVRASDRERVELTFLRYMEWLRSQSTKAGRPLGEVEGQGHQLKVDPR